MHFFSDECYFIFREFFGDDVNWKPFYEKEASFKKYNDLYHKSRLSFAYYLHLINIGKVNIFGAIADD